MRKTCTLRLVGFLFCLIFDGGIVEGQEKGENEHKTKNHPELLPENTKELIKYL